MKQTHIKIRATVAVMVLASAALGIVVGGGYLIVSLAGGHGFGASVAGLRAFARALAPDMPFGMLAEKALKNRR